MIKKYLKGQLFIWVLLSCPVLLHAHVERDSAAVHSLDFIQNKGQWESDIRYKLLLPAGALFLTDEAFVYTYAHVGDLKSQHTLLDQGTDKGDLRSHAYKVKFVAANRDARYEVAEKRSYYHNYFIGNGSNRWAGQVPLYGKVIRKNMYKGIDIVTYSKNTGIKYDIVVSPGADIRQIVLSYEGVQPEIVQGGHLRIQTSVNEIIEQAPYAYQEIEGKTIAVPCLYQLSGQQLTFKLPEGFDTTHTLIIDPAIVYSTFSGATALQVFSSCTTYDSSGNLYTGAICQLFGWPTTLGAYKTNSAYKINIAISKYKADGSGLIYATYMGGRGSDCNGFDNIHTMMVNKDQELIAVGAALSEDFPVTTGCFQDRLKPGGYNSGCGRDLFVTHFNKSGSAIVGSTFIGGNLDEPCMLENPEPVSGGHHAPTLEVAIDTSGNIWVTTGTVSNNFPVTGNAFQSSYKGIYTGMMGCVVFGLTPDCSRLLYSTYIGGQTDNMPYDIKINKKGNLVVCGRTYKQNPLYMPQILVDIPITAGVVHPSPLGNSDGFVTIINPTTGRIVASTYIGTAADDYAYHLYTDEQDNVYVLGFTFGDYPVSPGVYTIPASGDDASIFFDKLNPDLTASLASTRLAVSAQVPGINPQYGYKSYFMPTSFMVDQCGNTYLSGMQAGDNLPVTADAFMAQPRRFWMGVLGPDFTSLRFGTYFGAPVPNIWYTAYWFLFDHLHTGQHHSDPLKAIFYHSVCAGMPTTFPSTAGSFAPVSMGLGADAAVFKFDFSAFAAKDTISTTTDLVSCYKDTVLLKPSAVAGLNHLWNDGTASDTLSVSRSGDYYVQYRKQEPGCNLYVDSIHVNIVPLPHLIPGDTTCSGEQLAQAKVVVTAQNNQPYTYTWYDVLTGTSLRKSESKRGDSISQLAPGNYGLIISTASGCDTTLEFNLAAFPRPSVAVQPSDTTIRYGDSIYLSASGAAYYTWWPADVVDTTNPQRPLVKPRTSTLFTIIGFNEYGCRDSSYVTINIDYNMPDAIPNAFSPNGDGLNDEFKVSGIIYQKLTVFKIFNRYGQEVFSTSDPLKGWDGNFNGQPCDVGTYHYLIGLRYPDGKINSHKGDVTLIR